MSWPSMPGRLSLERRGKSSSSMTSQSGLMMTEGGRCFWFWFRLSKRRPAKPPRFCHCLNCRWCSLGNVAQWSQGRGGGEGEAGLVDALVGAALVGLEVAGGDAALLLLLGELAEHLHLLHPVRALPKGRPG